MMRMSTWLAFPTAMSSLMRTPRFLKCGAEACRAFGDSALCRDLLSNHLEQQQRATNLIVSSAARLHRPPQKDGAAILVRYNVLLLGGGLSCRT
jgi:hypothetical protein